MTTRRRSPGKVTLSNGYEVELTDRERMLMASVVITMLKDEGRG